MFSGSRSTNRRVANTQNNKVKVTHGVQNWQCCHSMADVDDIADFAKNKRTHANAVIITKATQWWVPNRWRQMCRDSLVIACTLRSQSTTIATVPLDGKYQNLYRRHISGFFARTIADFEILTF